MTARPQQTRLQTRANARIAAGTLFGALAFAAVFHWWASPWLQQHMGGEKLLDLMYWRTPERLDAALEAYSDSGRSFYRRVLLVDLLFPLVYVPLLALSVAITAPRLGWLRGYTHLALLLPIAGALSDWGENILLLIQTSQFPDHTNLPSWLAMATTLLKFTALVVSLGIIAGGLWASRHTWREDALLSQDSRHS